MVYNKPLSVLDLQIDRFKVVVGGEVVKYKNLTPNQKQQIDKAFPKINRALVTKLRIAQERYSHTDKCTTAYNHITALSASICLQASFRLFFVCRVKCSMCQKNVSDKCLNVPISCNSKMGKRTLTLIVVCSVQRIWML